MSKKSTILIMILHHLAMQLKRRVKQRELQENNLQKYSITPQDISKQLKTMGSIPALNCLSDLSPCLIYP